MYELKRLTIEHKSDQRSIRKTILAAGMLLSLAGCGSLTPLDTLDNTMLNTPAEQASEPTFRQKMAQIVANDPLFAIMAAELAAQRGDLSGATIAYSEAAKLFADPELARRGVELAINVGRAELALDAARTWYDLDPNNAKAKQTVLLLLLSANRVDEAMPKVELYLANLEQANAGQPLRLRTSRVKAVLDLMSRVPNSELAYQTAVNLLQTDLDSVEAQRALSQLASAAQMHEQAIAHLEKVIAKRPEERFSMQMAQLLEQRDGNTDSAVEYLSAQADQNSDWFSARLYLARVYTQQNNWQLAFQRFRELVGLQPTNYPLYSSLGFVSAKLQNSAKAEEYFEIYLSKTLAKERQNEILIYLTMGELLSLEEQYTKALKWLDRAPNGTQNLDVQLLTHQVYKKQRKARQAAKVLEQFEPQNEEDRVRLTLALSQFVEEIQKPDEAIRILDSALTEIPDQADLLYERAMVAERVEDLVSVEKYLRRLIEVRPENPHGYNALGYTFADNDIRLDEALTLIKKANALAPQDPYILDSLGWVYYKLEDLEQAELALTKAFRIRQDEEIGAHLLELYLAMEHSEKARALVAQLRQLFPDSTEIENVVQQVQDIKQ